MKKARKNTFSFGSKYNKDKNNKPLIEVENLLTNYFQEKRLYQSVPSFEKIKNGILEKKKLEEINSYKRKQSLNTIFSKFASLFTKKNNYTEQVRNIGLLNYFLKLKTPLLTLSLLSVIIFFSYLYINYFPRNQKKYILKNPDKVASLNSKNNHNAYVSSILGKAWFQIPGENGKTFKSNTLNPLKVRQLLQKKAIIVLGKNSYVNLNYKDAASTEVQIKLFGKGKFLWNINAENISKKSGNLSAYDLFVFNGKMSFSSEGKSLDKNKQIVSYKLSKPFRVRSPSMVAAVRGTVFNYNYSLNKETASVSVERGSVRAYANIVYAAALDKGRNDFYKVRPGSLNPWVFREQNNLENKALALTAGQSFNLNLDEAKTLFKKTQKNYPEVGNKKSKITNTKDKELLEKQSLEKQLTKKQKKESNSNDSEIENSKKNKNKIFKNESYILSKSKEVAINKPLVLSNYIYYGDNKGYLYCRNLVSSKLMWKIRVAKSHLSSTVNFAKGVLIGGDNGYLSYVLKSNGSIIWKLKIGQMLYGNKPLVKNNTIYVSSASGIVSALNKNGKQKWVHQAPSGVYSSPVLNKGLLIFGTENKKIIAVNRLNGKKVWQFSLKERVISRGPLVYANKVFVGGRGSYISALNAGSGKQIWKYKTAAPIAADLLLSGNKIFIAIAGKLIALNQNNGHVLWKKKIPYSKKVFLNNYKNRIFVTAGKKMILINKSGKIIKSKNLAHPVVKKPTIKNSYLYISFGKPGFLKLKIF